MTTPANQVWRFPNPIQRLAMPVSGGTTRSEHFTVLKGSKAVTIFVPNLATSTSLVIETLTPLELVDGTQTWVALSIFNLADGVLVAFDGLTESTAVTIPTSALGGGILSFTAADTQAASPLTIFLCWTLDG